MKGCKSWLLAVSLCVPLAAQAAGPESCASVRFADVGWTDIIVTTAVTRQVLESLNYKTRVNLLSVPVAYCSLANNDLDVFLDNRMPTMTNGIKQHAERGTVETPRVSLEGVKYTLATPQHVYDGGLRSFAGIARFSGKLGNKICSIKPGSDGNRVAQSMVDKDASELGKFKSAESSEADMFSQVQWAIRRNQWVVFLGWEPHPVNTRFRTKYPEGGDDFPGSNCGGATIYANVRKGYAQKCTNIGQLLKNLSLTLEMEDRLIDAVLNGNKKFGEAAKA